VTDTVSADALLDRCKSLAFADSILSSLLAFLAASGVVGEARLVQLLYLALTSRYLSKPVSIVVKGPSSAGKSHTTGHVLKLVPDEAYYALSGMSEKALAYSTVDLKHRHLVFFEAAGLVGDFATYLLRSLLSEGCIKYETVEKAEDGKMKARLITREGPTAVIITTTEVALHPENETRLLSVPVDDTPEQTRRILVGLARQHGAEQRDVQDWHALHQWIGRDTPRVVVPFAEQLAHTIPPVAIRLRRDFPMLLTLVQAHALLHRGTRETDADGRIVATLADYAIVRELVLDLFGTTAGVHVPDTIRETVEAVTVLTGGGVAGKDTTVTQVGRYLKLDTSSASRRVKAATESGFLENLETRQGRPAKVVLADPLPADRPVLPDVTAIGVPAFVTEYAEPDFSDPIGAHDEDEDGCVGTGTGSGEAAGTGEALEAIRV
jgi:hypothetical protein